MYSMTPKRLELEHTKDAIRRHLLGLSVNDRFMRFCSALSDYAINKYVDNLKLTGADFVFGVYEDMGNVAVGQLRKLVGMLHVAPDTKDSAEFALSVDADQRNKGIGDMLFDRGLHHCESVGIRQVYMNCLTTNEAIKRMAAKRGMEITTDRGESIARVNVNNDGSVRAFLAAAESTDLALYDTNCKYARQAWEDYVREIRRIIQK